MTDRVADIWGTRTPHAAGTAWPVRVDQYLAPATPEAEVTWHQSACVLCSNGCGMAVGGGDGRILVVGGGGHLQSAGFGACSKRRGMDVGVRDGRIVGVRGRAADRVNRGRLGPKGLFGWQANNSPDRLTHPLVRDGDALRPATWPEAMNR